MMISIYTHIILNMAEPFDNLVHSCFWLYILPNCVGKSIGYTLSVATVNYLLKSHLEQAFNCSFDRKQFGGEGGIAYTDGSVLFFIGIPDECSTLVIRTALKMSGLMEAFHGMPRMSTYSSANKERK